jgi:antitoxin component of MazEF toxin-antitoxin module
MTTKVQKTGNSLSVSIPKFVTQKLSLKKGSEVTFSLEGNKILIIPSQKKETLTDMLQSISKTNLPEFVDFGDDTGTEVIK